MIYKIDLIDRKSKNKIGIGMIKKEGREGITKDGLRFFI
jgi:hypothetical protein